MDGGEILKAIRDVSGELGMDIAASALWDGLKAIFGSGSAERESAERQLDAFLKLHGVTVSAGTVIDALAGKGVLSIKGSTLYAPDAIRIGAAPGALFDFKDSTSVTDKTKIEAGRGASMQGSNAEVRQNRDGSITFHTGGTKK